MTHHLTKFEQTQTPITLHITALTHDGRGIATYDDTHGDKSGKKVFISHALPTETVTVHLTKSKKSYDEADCSGVLTPSPHRTAPICPHFGVCGGCTLQHFDVDEQIRHKQSVLQNHLTKSGITPATWLPPIVGDRTHYRTKARLGVRYLPKTGRLIVGFRERASNFLTDIDTCPILDQRVGDKLDDLKRLLKTLKVKESITHLEIAVGENAGKEVGDLPSVALIVRHTKPINKADTAKLIHLANGKLANLFTAQRGR